MPRFRRGLTGSLFLLILLRPNVSVGEEKRRVALRLSEAVLAGPDAERVKSWARRSGAEIDLGPIASPVRAGFEAVYVATLPPPEAVRSLLSDFPVRLEQSAFVFDGRAYRGDRDAVALTDPRRPLVTVVLGIGAHTALRLAIERIFWRESAPPDYEVVSGELTKEGHFVGAGHSLTIDRTADRDEISAQDAFLKSFQTEETGGIRWRFHESDRGGIARWEPVLRRFFAAAGSRKAPLSVRLFSDPSAKARATGSTRPADLSRNGSEIAVDIDLSAPATPDCVTAVLAAAAFAAVEPRLLDRPLLAAAVGARGAARWWGRDVGSFYAFLKAARVEPTVDQVFQGNEEISPLFTVGAAASWIEAGARAEGEEAILRALVAAEPDCRAALERWSVRAAVETVRPPARRGLPPGFLRGMSYAMTNSIGGGYASLRSRETLARLAGLNVNSISVMPFAYSRDAHTPEISFVHRSPQGETDEGSVRAVADARSLGMTAMVKPQIWIPGAFVGDAAMTSEVEWRRWFDAYRRFLVHNALIAEAAGASVLCVGTELVGTETRRKEWLETIAAVRLATGATLTYAANWAAGASRVGFWDALDAIGVDFYDALSAKSDVTDAELEAGARRAATPLSELARRTGKPVILTEAGYPPVQASWVQPHDENTGRPPAPEDAARAIRAVFRAFDGQPWWRGVYWWKAFSDGRGARAGERGYNVLGAPAEKAIAEGFARLAGQQPAPR
jgi:hypothetical protein